VLTRYVSTTSIIFRTKLENPHEETKKKNLYVNSAICAFVVFMLDLFFFCFFVYVSNLVLKIMETVDRYVVNGNLNM
jgi:hypothetical protein